MTLARAYLPIPCSHRTYSMILNSESRLNNPARREGKPDHVKAARDKNPPEGAAPTAFDCLTPEAVAYFKRAGALIVPGKDD